MVECHIAQHNMGPAPMLYPTLPPTVPFHELVMRIERNEQDINHLRYAADVSQEYNCADAHIATVCTMLISRVAAIQLSKALMKGLKPNTSLWTAVQTPGFVEISGAGSSGAGFAIFGLAAVAPLSLDHLVYGELVAYFPKAAFTFVCIWEAVQLARAPLAHLGNITHLLGAGLGVMYYHYGLPLWVRLRQYTG